MSYSAVWSEAIPLGSLAASDIDQAIRDAKRDIRERVADMMGQADWSLDPLVPLFHMIGTPNRALSGLIRVPNNQAITVARNAANSADVVLSKLNATDILELAAGVITIDPTTGTLTFTKANHKISIAAGGNVDYRAAGDASSVLLIPDTGDVQMSTGQLALYSGNANKAPILIPDMASGVAPTSLADGKMWFIGNDLFRRIGGVTKKVTFA
jgi:hypothetical protein